MTESEIQRDIKKYLEDAGFRVYRMNSGYLKKNVKLAPPGTPDLMVISPFGKTTWIEVKTETGKVSDIQLVMHIILASYGQLVIIARSVEDVKEIVI